MNQIGSPSSKRIHPLSAESCSRRVCSLWLSRTVRKVWVPTTPTTPSTAVSRIRKVLARRKRRVRKSGLISCSFFRAFEPLGRDLFGGRRLHSLRGVEHV